MNNIYALCQIIKVVICLLNSTKTSIQDYHIVTRAIHANLSQLYFLILVQKHGKVSNRPKSIKFLGQCFPGYLVSLQTPIMYMCSAMGVNRRCFSRLGFFKMNLDQRFVWAPKSVEHSVQSKLWLTIILFGIEKDTYLQKLFRYYPQYNSLNVLQLTISCQ